jgi:hypothetical protein
MQIRKPDHQQWKIKSQKSNSLARSHLARFPDSKGASKTRRQLNLFDLTRDDQPN